MWMVLWFYGLWFYGFMVSWLYGFLVWVLWFYGFLVLWFHGLMVLWFYGFMAFWFYGSMVVWFYGVLVSWFQKITKFPSHVFLISIDPTFKMFEIYYACFHHCLVPVFSKSGPSCRLSDFQFVEIYKNNIFQ